LDIALIPSSASVARLRQSNDFIGTSVRDIPYEEEDRSWQREIATRCRARTAEGLTELPKKENLRRTVQ
jgi:hypothetical protein